MPTNSPCLAEFLFEVDLRADNTWAEVVMPTRRAWSSVKHPLAMEGEEETHMDFLLSSSTIGLDECYVQQARDFRSHHWPVVSYYYILSTPNTLSIKQFKRCHVNWPPSESWCLRVGEFSADWSDPLSVLGQLAQVARECRLPFARKFDFQDNLQDLLQLRRQHLDSDWRRQVNRAIYRTRRERKRFVWFQALKDACASGRAPSLQSKGGHVISGRLFGHVSPAEALSSHYSASFELGGLEEAGQESAVRQSVMQSWHSRPSGTHEFVCDLPRLESALKRLHLDKSSLDGFTAKMLRQLPHDELFKVAAAIQKMFRSLSFEAIWTVITASLIPKKAVTRSLSDMRPISGLCHFRTLLEYR